MLLGESMDLIQVKTILSSGHKDQWFGYDYNMNLYRGCSHGCIYCDSRSTCYQNNDFDHIKVKQNAIKILQDELSRKRKKGVIGIGAMSDPYNPFEKKYMITRQALDLIRQYHFGIGITTKSDLVVRDIDLLKQINKFNDVIVKISITTIHDDLAVKIEPNVASSSKRFEAVKTLSEAGIFVGILLHPLIPFLCDDPNDIKTFVKKAYESGAKFIHTYYGMTLREGNREYFYKNLDIHFPDLKKKYQMRYGYEYHCKARHYKELRRMFESECKKYGLLYRMKDIIVAYQTSKQEVTQLSLF